MGFEKGGSNNTGDGKRPMKRGFGRGKKIGEGWSRGFDLIYSFRIPVSARRGLEQNGSNLSKEPAREEKAGG